MCQRDPPTAQDAPSSGGQRIVLNLVGRRSGQPNPRHQVLEDMEFLRIELIVGEIQRENFRSDRGKARLGIIIG